jgi:Tfp pilus assembly protein PilF/arylsulfatase A-like enzyme
VSTAAFLRPAWPLLMVLLALSAFSCSRDADRGRVIVLGLDGVDPDVVELLVSEDKLPNFAKLRQAGAHARLLSSRPLLSPILWTTIATGKPPEQHAITDFATVNEKTGERLPVTSQMRRVKALWNVLSDVGRKVGVVGWWATWPAENVNGTIVSDHTAYHFLFREGQTGAKNPIGTVHPPELQEVVDRMVRRPTSLTASDLAPFVNLSEEEVEQPFAFDDPLGHFKWALATAESYRDIGLYIWEHQEPDALMVYIEGVDSSSHLFGHLFRADGLAGELAAQQQRYGGTVEAMYRYVDRIVGEYMQAMDDETTLIVLSDHGFQLGVLHDDPSKTRDMRRVSEKFHEIEGILYLYGKHIRPGSQIDRPTVLDIAPTILALLGVAPALDMPGRVLEEAMDLPVQERSLASFEGGGATEGDELRDPRVDAAILERLEQLGYLDTQPPSADRNLAGSLFQEGRLEEASEIYARLIAENPKDGALRASYGGVLGSLERYDEALEQLGRAIELKPINAEAYHNRGLIHERRGDVQAAITQYHTALRYRPGYPPSVKSLVRLSASADPSAPQTPAQKLASLMIEEASEAARRGDYAAAMAQLDEAQRIAPRYSLVYQYRSNVAFLKGDRNAAIQALLKAIELEPDNDLFRVNLKRLQRESDAEAVPKF